MFGAGQQRVLGAGRSFRSGTHSHAHLRLITQNGRAKKLQNGKYISSITLSALIEEKVKD